MTPARGTVWVRPVTTGETYGSLVIPESARQAFAQNQMMVVAVGLPEICEDEDCPRFKHDLEWNPKPLGDEIRLHPIGAGVQPGAWVIVRHRSLVPVGQDGDNLYAVRQSDVQAVLSVVA